MGWASKHIERLQAGETVQFRPRGNSMAGRVENGALVTVEPVKGIEAGDVVLCRVGAAEYLHLVKAVGPRGALIGNNKGRINGWTAPSNVYGTLVRVDP